MRMPIRAPDPHNLRSAFGKVMSIEADRECPGCGYNLRGLRVGAACPECGMPVTGPRAGESDDPLSLAPTRVIVALIRGCWAASIIVALAVASVFAPGIKGWQPEWSRLALVPLALLWVGAVMWLTPALGVPQAATRGFSRRGRLRPFARWMQVGWVLAAACFYLRHDVNMSVRAENFARVGYVIGFAIGLAAVVVLSILLERLANWARDDAAEKLFNWTAWTLPLSTLMLLIDVPLPAVQMLFTLLWLVGMGIFPYALISLSSSVTLSVVHAYEHRQREQRRAERQQRYDEQVERTVRKMDVERQRRGHV